MKRSNNLQKNRILETPYRYMTSKTLEQTKEVYKSCFLDEDFKDGGVH